ncbi:hypothetical protein CPB84DRAFT_308744 [Gymnopilus junonius]|uniref:Uncharacterized protein n=1 Tax=Gymnopilus junonius TaxID=109634 RepID=A0A9P5NW93_GYMJU|nr:hypothetical protein CPB84DRAFT_308744 [Gymnopilus junonius]
MYSAIRIGLGNPSVNNFILNRMFLNKTIYSTFPATKYNSDAASRNSTMYAIYNHPDALTTVTGLSQIQLVYACRFQQRKYIGPLIVSVMVATVSMFSSGWALYILIATELAKREATSGMSFFFPFSKRSMYIHIRAANKCDGHCFRHK